MKTSSSSAWCYRIIAYLAVAHAIVLRVIGVLSGPWWFHHLWVGLATLWLLWPIVLTVHQGRSLLRAALPLIVSLAILWPTIPKYVAGAGVTFGLPPGVKLLPSAVIEYVSAYRTGRAEAERDLRSGRLVLETYGFPQPLDYSKILLERYQIELKHIAGDTDVTAKVIGHAKGYNEISEPEIKRRFGDGVLQAAEEEAFKHWRDKSPGEWQ